MVKLEKAHEHIFVERKERGSLDDYPPTPKVFRPFNLVINIALFSKSDPDTYLTEFDPPFELWVPYAEDDLEKAKRAGEPLALAWYNIKQDKWVPVDFKDVPDQCDRWAGYGVALISEWDDPPIAWGT
jgi:hypothetical protein